MDFAKVDGGNKKAKKKPVMDELDRMKLAEKKKRRLQKALAASAAICAELEKKKMKKKEEQEKLYEEGASIAEAVALQVLLGEDSDDSSQAMLERDNGLIPSWDPLYAANMISRARLPQYCYYDRASANVEVFPGFRQFDMRVNYNEIASSDDHLGRGFYQQNVGDYGLRDNIGLSVDHVSAARAISSLKIRDNAMADSLVYNRVLGGPK